MSLDAVPPRELLEGGRGAGLYYEADGGGMALTAAGERTYGPRESKAPFGKFRQAMHLPKWGSRIWLQVTEVRVHRLQDISEADAIAEGVQMESADPPFYHVPTLDPTGQLTGVGVEEPGGHHAARSYGKLMDLLHGAGFWTANPWVAAYTFKREASS